MSSRNTTPEYLSAAQVMERFGGVSHMWLVRAMRDKGFPQPVRFGGRLRFFRLSDLEAWEGRMISGAAKKPPTRNRAAQGCRP